jgi:hypothetical protein
MLDFLRHQGQQCTRYERNSGLRLTNLQRQGWSLVEVTLNGTSPGSMHLRFPGLGFGAVPSLMEVLER